LKQEACIQNGGRENRNRGAKHGSGGALRLKTDRTKKEKAKTEGEKKSGVKKWVTRLRLRKIERPKDAVPTHMSGMTKRNKMKGSKCVVQSHGKR